MRALELAGKRFGRLVAVERLASGKAGPTWRCACDCGGTKDVAAKYLSAGVVSSCGCLVTTHGHASNGRRSKTYMAWDSMKARCMNQRHPAYGDYGGRGITVCLAWRSFDAFLTDMGEAPAGYSLDRIDNARGYEPGNCRWATSVQQNRNTRGNRLVTSGGVTRSIAEWSQILGWPHHVIASRLRAGWSDERAVGEPWKASPCGAHVERTLEFDR